MKKKIYMGYGKVYTQEVPDEPQTEPTPELKYYLVHIEEHNGEQSYVIPYVIQPQPASATMEEVAQYVINVVLKCWYGELDSEEEGYTSLESYDEQYAIAYFYNGCSADIYDIKEITREEWEVLNKYI